MKLNKHATALLMMFFLLVVAIPVTYGQDMSSPTGNLVFNSVSEAGQEITVMPIGESEAHNITQDPSVDIAGSISSDGSTVLFTSNRDGDFEIFTSDLSGENIIQLTDDPSADNSGEFSPDGSQITFISDRNGGRDVYVMDSSGENITQLTSSEANEAAPSWSPDGEHIAFLQVMGSTEDDVQGYRTVELNIGVVSKDGGDARNIAENMFFRLKNSVNGYFEWSPDSTAILYRSVVEDEDTELFLVDVVSGETVQLTDNDTEESGFIWTDEQQIIFSSFGGFRTYDSGEDMLAHLYIMDQDGGNIREITAQSNVLNPIQNLSFIPEYQQVLFELWTPGSDGNRVDLWAVDLEGNALVNLTNTPVISEGQYFYIPAGNASSD